MFTRREFGKLTIASLPLTLAFAQSKAGGVRIGVQSYSFRNLELDAAIAAMKDIGIAECELFSGHVEPRMGPPPGAGGGQRPPQAGPGGPPPAGWGRCRHAGSPARSRRVAQ